MSCSLHGLFDEGAVFGVEVGQAEDDGFAFARQDVDVFAVAFREAAFDGFPVAIQPQAVFRM